MINIIPAYHALIIVYTGAGFDFTCVSYRPLLTTDTQDTYIGGYMSGFDVDADVDFSRVVETGTGSGLPPNAYPIDHPNFGTYAKQLIMPASDGVERIGAFYCEGTQNRDTYYVPTIINSIFGKHFMLISHDNIIIV